MFGVNMYQAWCIFSVQRLTKKWNKGVRRQHHRLSNSDYYAFMWFFCVIFLCLWIDKVLLSCCCYCSVWTLSMWSRDGMRNKLYDCRKMTFVSILCKSLPSDMTKVAKFTKWFLPAVYCTARWTRLMLVSSFALNGSLMAEYFDP